MSESFTPYRIPGPDNFDEWKHFHKGANGVHPQRSDVGPFAETLRLFRNRKRLSQSKLAEAAGFDHSSVSRMESGSRMPSRDAVLSLALALTLDDTDTDALLASAGFMPHDTNSLIASEPSIIAALEVLRNRSIPAAVRDDLRHMIALLVRQAQRAAA